MLFVKIQANMSSLLLLIIVLIHAILYLNKKERFNKIIFLMMSINIILLFLETVGVVLAEERYLRLIGLYKLANMVLLLFIPVYIICGLEYVKAWIQKLGDIKVKMKKWIYVPVAVCFLLILSNVETGWINSVTMQDHYVRGSLFWIMPAVSYFYIAYGLLLFYAFRRKLSSINYVVTLIFADLLSITIAIQMAVYSYKLIWNIAGVLLVCSYVFMLIYQLQHDALTGLENRESYINYILRIEKRKAYELTAINIDLDDFKQINDQYGHQEGDEALKTFAKFLKFDFSLQERIFRLGGDEFLILIENKKKDQAIGYIHELEKRIDFFNQEKHKPYELKFSYGVDIYSDIHESIQDFLAYVDYIMYEEKERRRQKQQSLNAITIYNKDTK